MAGETHLIPASYGDRIKFANYVGDQACNLETLLIGGGGGIEMFQCCFSGVAYVDHKALCGAFGIALLNCLHDFREFARTLLQPTGEGDGEDA
ncbi:hypothetical protein CWO90_06645 [Bradyrhizobium sp. Leo121]|nr:hypothetical protein CWO90_06645 [Bradyrhizobium sp. Leo121]